MHGIHRLSGYGLIAVSLFSALLGGPQPPVMASGGGSLAELM
jgi:hypothetical protein